MLRLIKGWRYKEVYFMISLDVFKEMPHNKIRLQSNSKGEKEACDIK